MKEKAVKETKITISLPSLIHRIGGDHAKRAKTLAAEKQCDLKRRGRGDALCDQQDRASSTRSPRQVGTFGREVDTFGETKPKHHLS